MTARAVQIPKYGQIRLESRPGFKTELKSVRPKCAIGPAQVNNL